LHYRETQPVLALSAASLVRNVIFSPRRDALHAQIPPIRHESFPSLSTDQGREEALPAVSIPETGVEAVETETAALVRADSRAALTLPPVLLGSLTPEIRLRVQHFYSSVYDIFRALGEPAQESPHPPCL
jgi:hypothetical protein